MIYLGQQLKDILTNQRAHIQHGAIFSRRLFVFGHYLFRQRWDRATSALKAGSLPSLSAVGDGQVTPDADIWNQTALNLGATESEALRRYVCDAWALGRQPGFSFAARASQQKSSGNAPASGSNAPSPAPGGSVPGPSTAGHAQAAVQEPFDPRTIVLYEASKAHPFDWVPQHIAWLKAQPGPPLSKARKFQAQIRGLTLVREHISENAERSGNDMTSVQRRDTATSHLPQVDQAIQLYRTEFMHIPVSPPSGSARVVAATAAPVGRGGSGSGPPAPVAAAPASRVVSGPSTSLPTAPSHGIIYASSRVHPFEDVTHLVDEIQNSNKRSDEQCRELAEMLTSLDKLRPQLDAAAKEARQRQSGAMIAKRTKESHHVQELDEVLQLVRTALESYPAHHLYTGHENLSTAEIRTAGADFGVPQSGIATSRGADPAPPAAPLQPARGTVMDFGVAQFATAPLRGTAPTAPAAPAQTARTGVMDFGVPQSADTPPRGTTARAAPVAPVQPARGTVMDFGVPHFADTPPSGAAAHAAPVQPASAQFTGPLSIDLDRHNPFVPVLDFLRNIETSEPDKTQRHLKIAQVIHQLNLLRPEIQAEVTSAARKGQPGISNPRGWKRLNEDLQSLEHALTRLWQAMTRCLDSSSPP